ncbi:MAG TPA: arylsulfotransferase family protein [Solirubrobacteraceae bacterium]|nr:arylsulfotransferase family protein [Solirubrobacteraceae bacterium]
MSDSELEPPAQASGSSVLTDKSPSADEPLASTSAHLSRRRFLQVAGGVAGAAAAGAGAFEVVQQLGGGVRTSLPAMPVSASGPVRAFHSRPDLRPPAIAVTHPLNLDPGYLFMGPQALFGNQPGALAVDRQGEPVWFRPVSSGTRPWATTVGPSTYRGEPVLAWWEGELVSADLGRGQAVIVDRSYREVARVQAANGRQMDFHEFQLTPQGTALFTCYPEAVRTDLTSIGHSRQGSVLDSIFQEVDVRTGRLLLEWRGLDHIPVSESYYLGGEPYDYLHLNSVGLTPDGNLLVSGRHTSALYKVDRRTGQVIWRLGGKRSDFTIDPDARFHWQHDARQPTNATITVFDNAVRIVNALKFARGLVLKVDEAGRRVSLAQAFNHEPPIVVTSMGSVQILPSGHVVVGWGITPFVSEFTSSGRPLSEAHLLSGIKSYRSLLFPWQGRPQRPPDLAVRRSPSTGKTTVYASWNGDTETAYWQVHAGQRPNEMRPIGIARRRAFETAIAVGDIGGYLAVTALDKTGKALRRSAAIRS